MALECIPNVAHKSCQLCLLSLLICTLISENQDLEKSMSISNPRKFSDSANLEFFFRFSINQAFFHGGELEKKSMFEDLNVF